MLNFFYETKEVFKDTSKANEAARFDQRWYFHPPSPSDVRPWGISIVFFYCLFFAFLKHTHARNYLMTSNFWEKKNTPPFKGLVLEHSRGPSTSFKEDNTRGWLSEWVCEFVFLLHKLSPCKGKVAVYCRSSSHYKQPLNTHMHAFDMKPVHIWASHKRLLCQLVEPRRKHWRVALALWYYNRQEVWKIQKNTQVEMQSSRWHVPLCFPTRRPLAPRKAGRCTAQPRMLMAAASAQWWRQNRASAPEMPRADSCASCWRRWGEKKCCKRQRVFTL